MNIHFRLKGALLSFRRVPLYEDITSLGGACDSDGAKGDGFLALI